MLAAVRGAYGVYSSLCGRFTWHGRVRERLRRDMQFRCGSFAEWKRCAEELDRHEGNEVSK